MTQSTIVTWRHVRMLRFWLIALALAWFPALYITARLSLSIARNLSIAIGTWVLFFGAIAVQLWRLWRFSCPDCGRHFFGLNIFSSSCAHCSTRLLG